MEDFDISKPLLPRESSWCHPLFCSDNGFLSVRGRLVFEGSYLGMPSLRWFATMASRDRSSPLDCFQLLKHCGCPKKFLRVEAGEMSKNSDSSGCFRPRKPKVKALRRKSTACPRLLQNAYRRSAGGLSAQARESIRMKRTKSTGTNVHIFRTVSESNITTTASMIPASDEPDDDDDDAYSTITAPPSHKNKNKKKNRTSKKTETSSNMVSDDRPIRQMVKQSSRHGSHVHVEKAKSNIICHYGDLMYLSFYDLGEQDWIIPQTSQEKAHLQHTASMAKKQSLQRMTLSNRSDTFNNIPSSATSNYTSFLEGIPPESQTPNPLLKPESLATPLPLD
eukprot:TRINITY_DN2775_c0_g2_i1.p1 TRINITY_DN2775_c0_g2~~TRINITY_DN2775_c0_g2_i1.p1  ORF type:complete len:395 (-),score=133.44 TRINITY_DN2775_c0_g2_i1:508-1515(-)